MRSFVRTSLLLDVANAIGGKRPPSSDDRDLWRGRCGPAGDGGQNESTRGAPDAASSSRRRPATPAMADSAQRLTSGGVRRVHAVILAGTLLWACRGPRTVVELPLEHVHVTDVGFVPAAPEPEPLIVCPDLALRDVLFDVDSDVLREDMIADLRRAAALLKSQSAVKLVVEGHCDEQGSARYNRALGLRRARAVVRFLVASGIDEARIRAVTYGRDVPLRIPGIEGARARRVHMVPVVEFGDYRPPEAADGVAKKTSR